jgi:hypothetical protein
MVIYDGASRLAQYSGQVCTSNSVTQMAKRILGAMVEGRFEPMSDMVDLS